MIYDPISRPVLQLCVRCGYADIYPVQNSHGGSSRASGVVVNSSSTVGSRPTFDDAWYARVAADSRTFVIADRFVREQLPQDRDGFGDDFANRLDRIAGGLTPAFVAAACKMVASGFDSNVGAVAAGAVRDLDSYEEVLDAALDELADLNRSYEREGKEQWRAIKGRGMR